MKARHMILAVMLIQVMGGTSLYADVIHVDAVASGNNDGSSWADAYHYLQEALHAAVNGDEIRVAQGIYKPDLGTGITPGDRTTSFQLKNGVALVGGFSSGGSDLEQRDPSLYETILSGDLNGNDGPAFTNNSENSYHVLIGSGTDETAVLDGFTVTGGNADGPYPDPTTFGGGMYINIGTPSLINCTFKKNVAKIGGGMCNDNSSPKLMNCTFSNNVSDDDGGGIHNRSSSSLTLTNCIFSGNSAGDDGGGIRNGGRNCNPILTNCTFYGNFAGDKGGGMYGWDSSPKLTNCIFWANRDSGGVDESAQLHDDSTGLIIVNYSCIQGWTGSLGGSGNMGMDPCFVDASHGDFHLKSQAGRWNPDAHAWVIDTSSSLCIDAGDPNSNWTAELWPHGMCINMGAFSGTPQAGMSQATIGNVADLNTDGLVDYKDLTRLLDKWLSQDILLTEDLNRDGIVNTNDYAVLAREWFWQGQGWEPDDSESLVELRRLIHEEYSYWQLRGVDWDHLFDMYGPALNRAQTPEAFAEIAAELLAHAEDAHVRVYTDTQRFAVFSRSIEQNYNLDVLPTLVPDWVTHNNRVSTGRFPDGIGYILINHWSWPAGTLDTVFQALDAFRDTHGLIIDVRTNGGGSEPLAQAVAGCFVDQTRLYAKHRYRDITQPDGFGPVRERWLEPNPAYPRYTGQVMVLMGEVCMSSCDAFLLMMKQVPECTLIGVPSYGSSGNPKPHRLPNGVTVDLPSWLALRPDETCFEGEGIFPHMTVEATQQELATHDPVLDAALALLRSP